MTVTHLSRRAFHRSALISGGALAMANSPAAAADPASAKAITTGPKHHFFGYYEKSPWNASGRYLLAHESDFCDREGKPGEAVRIGLIDTHDGDRFLPLDSTAAWSMQQGSMLQWLGSAPDRKTVYNIFDGDDYRVRIRDIETNAVRTLPRPIYALSANGTQAVSLPFDRLQRLRPGYGYVARPERTPNIPAPADDGIWWMNMATSENRLIIPLSKLAAYRPDARFEGAHHWVNHLQFNPSGTWFVFLHRWKKPDAPRQTTRMFVARPDGTELRLLWDTGMVSHFDWRDDRSILAWVRTESGTNAFALKAIDTGAVTIVGEGVLTQDGHCSYSPDRRWVLNDTYPDRERLQHLMLFRPSDSKRFDLGAFFEPPNLKGPYRCDLHPRWNRDGTQVCFDSTHVGGQRQMYLLDVTGVTRAEGASGK